MRRTYWVEIPSEKSIVKHVSRLEANIKIDVKEIGVRL